ncbi:amidohydrolase [Sphingomonas sp. TF3]|uniref:amidohydrolase family protein n=1 Tax=Sphingomonas sp. TF3 TaxID=2495580 RepID=UPI000F88EAB8|nr:amidohydrolase family protein [Sphingomonas sp. TF3]RUN76995.1 amidohydrolase [Sphingomonas sp. TF3]
MASLFYRQKLQSRDLRYSLLEGEDRDFMNIVDTHPHVVSSDTARYPISPLGDKRSDWSHERSITTEELITAMDAAGIAKAALVHSSTTYGFVCDYAADAIAAYPDRLTGVFSVNVLADDAVEKMEHWYAKGLTGMRIYVKGTTVTTAWLALDDPRLLAVYECAASLGITVAVNVNAADGFAALEAALQHAPKVKFLLDHAGRADYSSGEPFPLAAPLLGLSRFPNLYLKVTSVNFLKGKGWSHPAPILERLVSEFGADRLAWGSNYPASPGGLMTLLDVAIRGCETLSAADREWIFSKTALSLYPALASPEMIAA